MPPERPDDAGRPTPGTGALARALDRWRRAGPSRPGASGPPLVSGAASPAPGAAGDAIALAGLARRLDDVGCAYGRVSEARLDHLTRAYERLDTKLNAVLMAAMGTLLSTVASLLLYYARGGAH